MSMPSSLRAYEDCRLLFEAATADPKGARALIGTQDEAIKLRTRLHYYRKLDREANATAYPGDHPLNGQSLYDDFVIQMYPDEGGEWWLYIQPRVSKIRTIEGLSQFDDEDLLQVESNEVHLIEDKTNG